MLESLSRTASRYSGFYAELISEWWSRISYWEYIGLMVLSLLAGAAMLRRPLHGFE